MTRIGDGVVRRQIEVVLQAWGLSPDQVVLTAEILVDADLKGIDSHGISMLIFYDQLIRAGQINVTATPHIVRQTATTALIDGDAGMGHPAAAMAIELAIEKCLFAQIFGSTLGGGSFSPIRNRTQESAEPDNVVHFFLALNPAAFRPFDAFQADLDDVVDASRQTKPADPAQRILIPGDPERAARAERMEHGISMPDTLRTKLREIAECAGAAFLLT